MNGAILASILSLGMCLVVAASTSVAETTPALESPIVNPAGEAVDPDDLAEFLNIGDFTNVSENLRFMLLMPRSPHEKMNLISNGCVFSSSEGWYNTYGPFEGFDEKFREQHIAFERLLCAKAIRYSLNFRYMSEAADSISTEDIISKAISCGYERDELFPRFAILTLTAGDKSDLFDGLACGEVMDWGRKYLRLSVMWDNYVTPYAKLTDFLGSADLAESYFQFLRVVN